MLRQLLEQVLLTAHHPRTLILVVVQVRRCSDRQELAGMVQW
jgi:hypothetical protein